MPAFYPDPKRIDSRSSATRGRVACRFVAISFTVTITTYASGCFLLGDGAAGGDTEGAPGADDGTSEGGADETGGGDPGQFELRLFVAQHLEYDNADENEIPGVYDVPEQCLNTDIVDDTFSLATGLQDAGWAVRAAFDRYREPGAPVQARPENWAESYPGHPFDTYFTTASDEDDADAYDLAIYSGHGSAGGAGTNFPANADPIAACTLDLQADVRLGLYCGRKTKIAMYSASCVAGYDEFLCPPPPPDPDDADGWGPWPSECWEPLICTLGRSRIGHTLAFTDSPIVSVDQEAVWYGLAVATTPTLAWINTHAVDEGSGQANQPSVFLLADSGVASSLDDKIYKADITTGEFLAQIPLTTPQQGGMINVKWNGSTGLFDQSGEEVIFGAQTPELNEVCIPDHGETCYDGTDPPGAIGDECPAI